MEEARQLAVLTRRVQWLLDDVAHDLARERCSADDAEAVATALDELAAALRASNALVLSPDDPVPD